MRPAREHAQMFQDIIKVRLVPETVVVEHNFSSREDLGSKVNLLEFVIFPAVFIQKFDIAFFRLKTSQVLTLGKGFQSGSKGIQADVKPDDAIFKGEEVEDNEDSVVVEVGLLHHAVFEGDRILQRGTERKADAAFHLRANHVRVDRQPAVHRADHAIHLESVRVNLSELDTT